MNYHDLAVQFGLNPPHYLNCFPVSDPRPERQIRKIAAKCNKLIEAAGDLAGTVKLDIDAEHYRLLDSAADRKEKMLGRRNITEEEVEKYLILFDIGRHCARYEETPPFLMDVKHVINHPGFFARRTLHYSGPVSAAYFPNGTDIFEKPTIVTTIGHIAYKCLNLNIPSPDHKHWFSNKLYSQELSCIGTGVEEETHAIQHHKHRKYFFRYSRSIIDEKDYPLNVIETEAAKVVEKVLDAFTPVLSQASAEDPQPGSHHRERVINSRQKAAVRQVW